NPRRPPRRVVDPLRIARMNENGVERSIPRPRSRSRAWILAAAGVLLLLVASGTYGFLVYSRHLFPFKLLRKAQHRLHHPRRFAQDRRVNPAESGSPTVESIRQLANLPYLPGYRPPTPGGVIRAYDRARFEDGLNFFTSSHAPVATLMDMDGT